MRLQLYVLLLIEFAFSFISLRAFGACSSPAAQAGAIEYFTASSQYKLCDGTNWAVIELDTTDLGYCNSQQAKGRKYDSLTKAPKVCNGTNYVGAKCTSQSVAGYNSCTTSGEIRLKAADGAANDNFGHAVTIKGDTAIVGAYRKTVGANATQGAVYVFVRTAGAWIEKQKLTASDGAAGDLFGRSIFIYGDTLVVGAYNKKVGVNNTQGAAYIFTRSNGTWTEQQKLTSSDGAAGDNFGVSVSLYEDTVVIGAFFKTVTGKLNSGKAYVFTRTAGVWTEQQILTASDGAAEDRFGFWVAVEKDTAIIGAFYKTVGAAQQGVAYVFTRSGTTWTQQQQLTASDAAANDWFGYTISLSGNTVLIAAPQKTIGANAMQGAAYVFVNSGGTWVQQQKLTASDGAANDLFGWFLALSGNTAAVGAYKKTVGANATQGAVYAFIRTGTTWTQQQNLVGSDGAASDQFGAAVALDGETALIGANNKTVDGNAAEGMAYIKTVFAQKSKLTAADGVAGGYFGAAVGLYENTAVIGATYLDTSKGAAYIFTRSGSTWTLQQKITASDGVAGDTFGRQVAIYGNTVIIGAHGNNGQGAAYVFVRTGNTWSQQQKLTASDGAAGYAFGSVSLYGDTAVVGAQYSSVGGVAKGAAYVFTRSGSTWTEQQKIFASDGAADDLFGLTASVYKDTVLIGASMNTVGANTQQGAAYVFTRSAGTWTQQQKLTASDGTSFIHFAVGTALYEDTVVIGAPDVTGGGAAYVFTRSGGTWSQQQKLIASDRVSTDAFGQSVAIYGNTVVIGAHAKNSNRGAAYVFTRSGTTWTEQQKLIASDGAANDQFGFQSALYGNSGLIGAWNKTVGGNLYQGAAYVFDWTLESQCVRSSTQALGTVAPKSTTASWTALSNISLSAGNALLVCLVTKGEAVTDVSWNGTALTADASATSASANVYIYSLTNVTAGTGNIVVSAGTGVKALTANAVSGLATSSMLDKQAAAVGTSTTPSSGITATTTQAAEFLFGCIATNGPDGDAAGSWGSGFQAGQRLGSTGNPTTSNMTASDGFLEVSQTAAYSAAKSGITSSAWAAAIATYKIPAPTANVCLSYGFCTKEGAIDYSAGNGLRWCDGSQWRQINTVP